MANSIIHTALGKYAICILFQLGFKFQAVPVNVPIEDKDMLAKKNNTTCCQGPKSKHFVVIKKYTKTLKWNYVFLLQL